MAFKLETTIDVPLEKVFEFMTDTKNAPDIYDYVVKTEKVTEGPIQEGTEIKEVKEIRGREITSTLTVLAYTLNETYAFKNEVNGYTVEYQYTLRPNGEGTTIEFNGILRPKGIKSFFFKPMFERIIKTEDSDHLDRLKKLLEKKDKEEENI
ncbi:SRPBCC family protein [Bacillus luteolus]|uniref:SRPBCC family protein n=1 Tax=Litchfieldia luteola TaxID=682179 RepID=A0ABR9QJ03_9BACI|nr:SRPBCC family protein [Cytobacillus luteolus]MBE4908480.1 SRPBCC family protein [Cytobacillus luteolus]MBP1941332.1 hypothetical protein [Cytobacillus luteolus]